MLNKYKARWHTLMSFIAHFRYVFHDIRQYFYYSTVTYSEQKNLRAELIAHSHSFERAFSLKRTRNPFGRELFASFQILLSRVKDPQRCQYEYNWSKDVINDYHNFLKNGNKDLLRTVVPYAHHSSNRRSTFREIFSTRHSIRDFADTPLQKSNVLRAITLAKQHTPSACNRQGYKIFFVKDKTVLARILQLQSGNAGIEKIQGMLIIVADYLSFFGSRERNEPYLDSGIFLMNVLLCLHYYNIAGCTLNWAVDKTQELALLELLKTNAHLKPVAMIALGSYSTHPILVPSSRKKKLKDILEVI